MRTPRITITELTEAEANRLKRDETFNRLRPSQCSRCKRTTDFSRRIFRVRGVRRHQQNNDTIQYVLSLNFKQQYAIESISFKEHDGKFFVDSAACKSCGSTSIVYDIELDEALFESLAKFVGRAPAEIRDDVERVRKMLSAD
jgi:hypothetical protein